MARLEVGDIEAAETYIKTSMGLADKKGPLYSKRQILDQRARLYLKKNTRINVVISNREIKDCIEDLNKIINERGQYVIHPLRSSNSLLDFLESRAEDLPKDLAEDIEGLVKLMLSKIPEKAYPFASGAINIS